MKRLTLFRHAKSGAGEIVTRDFDRSLNEKGMLAAAMMGEWMSRKLTPFDSVIISSAVRTRQTWAAACVYLPDAPEPQFEERAYLASSVTLLDVLRETGGDAEHILLLGHNPGLEDIVFDLVPDDGSNPLRDEVYSKFPTASVAELECSVDSWGALSNGCGTLTRFTRPRDLDPDFGPDY